MTSGTYVVTGGNSGIGKAIALELASKKLQVAIVCRDSQKGSQALEEIRKSTENENVTLVVGDLGTIQSCRALAFQLLESYPDLRVLINNAGIWNTACEINADGLESTFMVNHMAPFILGNLLLDRLKANAPARIVNVNAGLYIKGNVDLEKTPYGRDFSKFGTYANTKLCNVLYSCELARRIAGSGVTVNALHPGVIRTNLGNTGGVLGIILKMSKRFFGTPKEGAQAPVWLATSPEIEGISGRFFNKQKEWKLTARANDKELAIQLWDLSNRLAGN